MAKNPKKRLGLSTEPQPVFVGSSFALIMLLMQVYCIVIYKEGNIVGLFNNPRMLAGFMLGNLQTSFAAVVAWLMKIAMPVLMVIFAIIWGKKRAGVLAIPCCLVLALPVLTLLFGSFTLYHISYAAFTVTGILHALTAVGLIKSAKPVCIVCILFSVVSLGLALFKLPPFGLDNGSYFLSDMIYFVCYHLVVFNYARAIPMQRAEREKAANKG